MKKTGLILATAFGLTVAAQGVNIAWDGTTNTITDPDTNPPGDPGNSSSIAVTQTTVFSTASTNSPATTAGIYDAAVAGSTSPGDADYYHALGTTTGLSSYTIWDGGNADLLGRMQMTGATSGTFSSMLAWDVTADIANPTLDNIGVTGFGDFGANASNGAVRFLIQDSGGSWHAAAASNGSNAAAIGLAWVAFTPINNDNGAFGAVTTPSLDSLQRVGYYQSFDTTGGGGIFSTGFNASFVPEPSAAILSAFGVLGLLRRRRA